MKPFHLLKVLILLFGFILIPSFVDDTFYGKPTGVGNVQADTLDVNESTNTTTISVAPGKLAVEPGSLNIGIPIILFSDDGSVKNLTFTLTLDEDWLTCRDVRVNFPNPNYVDAQCNQNNEIEIDISGPVSSSLEGTLAYAFVDVVTVPPQALPIVTLIEFSQGPYCSNGGGVPVSCTGSMGEIIVNQPPTVENISLSPTNPSETDDLSPTFELKDPDNANNVNATLRWTLNGQTQAILTDQSTVPAQFTQQYDEWCVQITPEEEIATLKISGEAGEQCVRIGVIDPNLSPQPTAEFTLLPEEPIDTSTLAVNFIFNDPDNDSLGADVHWYRDGLLQPAFNRHVSFTSGEEIEDYLEGDETQVGETWCVTLTISDNQNTPETFKSNCVIIHPSDNKLPQIQEVSIFPPAPEPGSFLLLSYAFNDTDGDTEQATQIRWYRDGVLQSAYNDNTAIASGIIQEQERWHATIRPHDGTGFGMLYKTSAAEVTSSLDNSDPEITMAQINVESPSIQMALSGSSGGELQLAYDYLDINGDLETNTIIQWYRNLEYQPHLDGLTRIPDTETKPGDIWYATVYPHDAESYGARVPVQAVALPDTYLSMLSTSSAPEVLNVYISPAFPGPNSDLSLHYEYNDVNGDPEGNTIIRWKKNNSPEPFNDRTIVPHDYVNIGEVWCAFITPHDGELYGAESGPHCVTINPEHTNSPPQVRNNRIEPENRAGLNSDLHLYYDFFDPDDQAEGNTEIKWYRRSAGDINFYVQEAYNNLTVIPGSSTSPGDEWLAKIRPHDGYEFGGREDTKPVRINHPPSKFQTISITPANPHDQQSLRLLFDLNEIEDDDEEDIPDKWIDWYRNGNMIADEHGAILSSEKTATGDVITATIEAYDGFDSSEPIAAPPVTIFDAPPNYSVLFLPFLSKPSEVIIENPDQYEPNNSQGTAASIDWEETYDALPDDINDWYTFKLEALSLHKLELTVNNYHAHGQVVLYRQENFPLTIVNSPDWRHGGKFAHCYLDDISLSLFRCLIANDGRHVENMKISANLDRPGNYLVRVYTTENFNEDDKYALRVHEIR